ncbi:MAG TPA: tetratricopeptide repeat protein [Aggregatilineales bacterium]|nr:tetratricopeptide repeat protein [Aggregatilineales bacterium]
MNLRTPKRYQRGGQRRRVFGSWRWRRNLILLVILAGFGYWVYYHPDQTRQSVDGIQERLGEFGNDIATRIPQQPSPTPNVGNELVAANAAYQSGDFRRAIENYRMVIAGQPNNLEAHYRLTLLLIITSNLGADQEQMQEALKTAEKTINADPEAPDGWAIKSMALLWADKPGEATAFAQQALEIDPDFVQAKAFLSQAYWEQDRTELAAATITEATEYLREQGSASPETVAMVFRTEGYIAERQLDRETAIKAYEFARSAAPMHSYISLELALSYFGNGQTDEAIALLKNALDANPRDTSLMFQLARVYVFIGDSENAGQTLQRCIEIDSDYPGCLSWLGGLQFFAGNYTQAINNLERAIENGSEDIEDWWQLGRAHANMLRCDLAIPVFREGYQRATGDAERQDKFAGGLRDCGAGLAESSAPVQQPVDATPSDFFTATPDPAPNP